MFIEVTSINKFMVNTDAIAYIAPSYSRGIDGGHEQCAIYFKNPINSRGGNLLIVNETYDEVKQMIMEG